MKKNKSKALALRGRRGISNNPSLKQSFSSGGLPPQASLNYNSQLNYAMLQFPHYFKHLKDTLEAHKLKEQSIVMRNQIKERQNRLNYTNELERIRGVLSQTNPQLRDESIELLKKRKTALENLGAKAVEGL
jgi:hypothetical protein